MQLFSANAAIPSLVKADSFYANFTNLTFQKIPIPHLTHTIETGILNLTCTLLYSV